MCLGFLSSTVKKSVTTGFLVLITRAVIDLLSCHVTNGWMGEGSQDLEQSGRGLQSMALRQDSVRGRRLRLNRLPRRAVSTKPSSTSPHRTSWLTSGRPFELMTVSIASNQWETPETCGSSDLRMSKRQRYVAVMCSNFRGLVSCAQGQDASTRHEMLLS